jgi:small redox-active disulfide protein 2
MEIKVLGTGCPKCKALTRAVEEVINETGMEASVIKVEDINEIMQHGVMVTPALMVNNKVVATGKVLKKEEIKKLLN